MMIRVGDVYLFAPDHVSYDTPFLLASGSGSGSGRLA
jgi:hypothetical protein